MARQSRMRKTTTQAPKPLSQVGTKSNLTIFSRDPDKRHRVSQEDPFWHQWGWENKKLARRYPMVIALRNSLGDRAGEWIIYGPAQGVQQYRDLAIQAAQHIGCKEGPEGCVQYWLAHINGEHLIKAKLPDVNPDEIDLLTQHSNGRTEFHMGRQAHAGGENFTDSFDRPKSTPAPVPSVIIPGGSDFIK